MFIGGIKMKKLVFMLWFAAAGLSHAGMNVETFLTAERQSITLGDTVEDMQMRMKASPITVNSYVLPQKDQKEELAIDYTYEIENMRYVITVVNGKISQIQTENLNK